MPGDDEALSLPNDGLLFEHAAAGLLLTSPDGTIRRANAAFCRWIGHEAAALVGKQRVQALFTMGGRVFFQTHALPLLQIQGSVAELKLDMVHHNGHHVPMLLNAIRREHEGQIWHEWAIMVVTDRHKYEAELLRARKHAEQALASRKEAQDQLRLINEQLSHADRRKDEFLATLAHELRNPLAPMRNVLELLKLKDLADPQLRWSRDVLGRQLQHLTHLVDDLLEISRITQGKLELRMQRVDLGSAVRSALEAASPLAQAASHTMDVVWPDQALVLNADPTRLTQIILNLINNAIKYTPPHGHIWLRAEQQGPHAVVSVRDSGIGIQPEHLAGIFEMFSQLTPALSRSQGGLGIGLSLVRGLVDLHGGTVTAHSAGTGQGSEFVLRLPLAPARDDAASQASGADSADPTDPAMASTRQRILVVDDNEDAAESLEMLLGLHGHEVKVAKDGRQAFASASAFLPDVILLDIGLPHLNGYEVARLIRQADWGGGMCLIALTGWGQAQDKQAALDAGFDHHLTKPVDPSELEAILLARA